MGVPSLFIYLKNKYGQVSFVNDKIQSKLDTNLYFDFNCLIHPIVNDILEDPDNKNLTIQEFYAIVFSKIKKYTDKSTKCNTTKTN